MIQQTSNTYSKLAAMGILVFVLYMGWILLASPYLGLWEDRIRGVEILQKQLASLNLIIDDKDKLNQQFSAINNSQSLKEVFLSSKTGALADVKFQRIIKQIATRNGNKLIRSLIETRKSRTKNKLSTELDSIQSVTVKVVMQGNIKAIYSALHELENSRPLILVSNFEISHNQSRYKITGAATSSLYMASYDATAFIL